MKVILSVKPTPGRKGGQNVSGPGAFNFNNVGSKYFRSISSIPFPKKATITRPSPRPRT